VSHLRCRGHPTGSRPCRSFCSALCRRRARNGARNCRTDRNRSQTKEKHENKGERELAAQYKTNFTGGDGRGWAEGGVRYTNELTLWPHGSPEGA
jgi:hypothetical protein